MRPCLIILALLLAACGPEPRAIPAPAPIPADLLVPPPGWTGPTPRTEGQLADATAATIGALNQCHGQLRAIADIVTPDS